MPISIVCPQGHKLNAKEKLAGKRVKCPKCGSVVKIPEADAQSHPPAGDAPPLKDPLPAQAEVTNAAKKKQDSPSKLSVTSILAMASGSAVLGLLFIGLLAWFLFGGSDEKPPTVAENNVVPPAEVAQDPAPQPSEEPQSETTVPEAQPVTPEPTAPAREPQPLDLTRIDLDKRLDGFKLPGATWAAAYDEITGRLAITNDEKGVLLYDLDDLLAGNPAPVAALPTDGLPTAVCLKPLPDRRAFVIAGQKEASLLLVDAESLQPIGKILLEDLAHVDFLTGSSNPDDPFVYYSTHRYDWADPSASKEETQKTSGRLGRVNLITGEQDGHTKGKFVDVTVSPDGSRLYARPYGANDGVTCVWNELLSYPDLDRRKFKTWRRNYASSPVCSLGNAVSINAWVYTPSMSIFAALLDHSPAAAFHHRPLWIGFGECEIVFASANDYRRLSSVPLPGNWLKPDRAPDPVDYRFRPKLSLDLRSAFLDTRADSTRKMAILTFSEHLVLAPLDRMKLPAEPSLLVRTVLPGEVAPGELLQVELELETEAEGVVFEYVPNTDWLPDEKQTLLGILPPGEPSPKLLELRGGVSAEDSFVMLKSLVPLKDFEFPVRLRIGREVMLATEPAYPKLMVKRSRPVAHGSSERVAVVDEAGRDLMTPTAPAKPQGRRLVLAAWVNNQQDTIFINDIRPLLGEELPLEIQVADEKMVVTAFDDFRKALIVTRTEPANHSVTSEVFVLADATSGADPGPALPKLQGRTFSWTPTADQLGKHTIRMRATAGEVTHEWFWDIAVERGGGDLPFQVVGIEPEPGTSRAVIWGQSVLAFLNPARESQPQPNTYFIGIYDLAEQRLLRHVEVPKPIMAAALDETGVYASLIAFDVEPKADHQAELARQRAVNKVAPTQIVRFDVETLNVVNQVAIPKHSNKLQVIAGRYLAAFDRWRGETFRFNVPDLTSVEPQVEGYPYPVAGRVRDGWVWDGIVWDEELKKPRLLLFPVHFASSNEHRSEPQMIAAERGTIYMRTQGCYTCTWCPGNVGLVGEHSLRSFPAGLSSAGGLVQAYSWAALSRPRVGPVPEPTSVKLVDLRTVTVAGDSHTRQQRTKGYVTEADGQVHVALLGKLYSVALDRLVPEEESFRFVEQQDRFVLEVGKSAKLAYSAPGAAKYHFQLWYNRPVFGDDQPAVSAESSDGTFTLALDQMDHFITAARGIAGIGRSSTADSGKSDPGKEYLQRIEPAYKRLTGREPRGVVFPVYVSVIAEHEDGQQKAGLAHSYLIEVPIQGLQEQKSR